MDIWSPLLWQVPRSEKCPPVREAASANIAHPARGVCHLGPASAFIVSLNTGGLSKGVETDPRIFVGFPARELPPPTHSQHPHMGSPTHWHRPRPHCRAAPQGERYRLQHCLGEGDSTPRPARDAKAFMGYSAQLGGGRRDCPGWAPFG